MPLPTHVTLLASDLLPPPQFISPPDLPRLISLETILARSAISRSAGAFLEEAVLCEFGMAGAVVSAVVIAQAPVAALTYLADNGTMGDGKKQTWLRADPVHLHVSRDNVQLMDSHVVEPTLAEAQAIAITLNQHLEQDGLRIEVLDDARWYMAIPADEAPSAAPLWKVAGASVYDQLPVSNGGINWRQLQNELQMLLHDHPVNAAREEKGVPTINGIWLWGAGALATIQTKTAYGHMAGKLTLARGLAMEAGIKITPSLPDSFDKLLLDSAQNLVVLHTATRALRSNQRYDWIQAIEQLERDWFTPALAAWDAGQLESLTLLLPNETGSLRVVALPKATGWLGQLKTKLRPALKIIPLHTYL
jgi:hypothetical protein